MDDKIIFLNNSINQKSEDAIGYDTYVDKLNIAINSGAKMIAITSPFGSGKTTIIDLLAEKRSVNKNEKILKIPMWSQLNSLTADDNNSIELHKNFLYQISSAIDKRKGTYISRMLSGNYGLLKLHVNKIRYWVTTVLSLIFAFIGVILEKYSETICKFLPFVDDIPEFVSPMLLIIAIVFFVITITCTEILFSSKNSESKRVISADEIIDIYRNEIINFKGKKYSHLTKSARKSKIYQYMQIVQLNEILHNNKIIDDILNKHKEKTYIIVIEDLDRSNNGNAVIKFLTELRKYYIPDLDCERLHNNIVFIVNIKPETMLFEDLLNNIEDNRENDLTHLNNESSNTEGTTAEDITKEDMTAEKTVYRKKETAITECNLKIKDLYAKLFDFVLDLQTININDYETVLNNLLSKHISYFQNKGIYINEEDLSKTTGMQWIIRGRKLDIREIKHRLNRAIIIYETLLSRFPDKEKEIDFNKCAVASYIMCAYETDFNKTDDDSFDTIVELNMQKMLVDFHIVKEKLNTENENYSKDIRTLVLAKLITSDYRMYFYNYPQGSDIYTNDENAIINAILYDEYSDNLNDLTAKILENRPIVLKKAFEKLEDLQLPLPSTVINTENLFVSAVKNSMKSVLAFFNNIAVTDDSIDKTIDTIIKIMQYDKNRFVYTDKTIVEFLNCWEKQFEEKYIVKLREALCKNFHNEITLYKDLFFNTHNIISLKEYNYLPLKECVELTNKDSVNFTSNHVISIVNKFLALKKRTENDEKIVQSFLVSSSQAIEPYSIVGCFFDFMKHVNKISPDLACIVTSIIESPLTSLEEVNVNDDENDETIGMTISKDAQKEIFNNYLELINNTAIESIPECVFEQINTFENFDNRYDYTESIADKMYDKGYILTYILIACKQKYKIDFSDEKILIAIKENEEWLNENLEDFFLIRKSVIIHSKNLSLYSFLFTPRYPIITDSELISIFKRHDIDHSNIMNYIQSEALNDNIIIILCKYLNRKAINNNAAYDILLKVSDWTKEQVHLFFSKINFITSIQYYRFAKDKRYYIKRLYNEHFELETTDGILDFMEHTQYLEETLEKRLHKKCDEEQEKRYIRIIQTRMGPATQATINNILNFKYYEGFDPSITAQFFNRAEYVWYVVSNTMFSKKFVIEKDPQKLTQLWPTYIDIFAGRKGFVNTKQYMSLNAEFLKMIVANKEYANFPDEALLKLSQIRQSADLIEEVFSRGDAFAIEYFSSFDGFLDTPDAKKFVELLESHEDVLISDEVKNEAYNKLVDPSLKGRYTRLRKMYGLEN